MQRLGFRTSRLGIAIAGMNLVFGQHFGTKASLNKILTSLMHARRTAGAPYPKPPKPSTPWRGVSHSLFVRNLRAMGSCATHHDKQPLSSEHPSYAPMWVVGASQVLRMTGKLQPHQVLKADGLLVERAPEMFVIFVSHQWLGYRHPDPQGQQLAALQGILRNLMARRLKVESDITSQFYGKNYILSKAEHHQISEGYLWLDYLCVPQLVEGYETQGLPEEQLRYVHSIPCYVDLSHVFLALVPKAVHENGVELCDYYSWLQRGSWVIDFNSVAT